MTLESARIAMLPEVIRREIVALLEVRPPARLGTEMYRVMTRAGVAYLKVGSGEAGRDLEAEHARLEWLRGKLSVPVAHVLAFAREGEVRALLMSELPGEASHAARRVGDRRDLMILLASALKQIHAIPIEGCPFSDTLAGELREAERRAAAGELDLAEFNRASGGRSPDDVLAWLRQHAQVARDLVFTHGDYCMPNVLVEPGRVSGIVDWGIAGVADRHRDLLGVLDSVPRNCGEAWVPVFLEAYGIAVVDQERIALYNALDWFFLYHHDPE